MTTEGEAAHDACSRKLDEVIAVLQQHARVLEKHATAIDGIGRVLRSVDAGVKSVVDAQKTQNQLTANLHQMYSRLRCMVPDPPDACPIDDAHEEFKRRTPSEEVRQLRLLGQNGDGET